MLALFQVLAVSLGIGLGLTNGRGGGHFTAPPAGSANEWITPFVWMNDFT